MIRLFTTLILAFFTAQAQAHFEIGTYDGQDYTGTSCSFTIHSVNFKDNTRHPLNERVQMTMHFLNEKQVTMSHLAQVDLIQQSVRPKAKTLSYVWATTTGAGAIELIMNAKGPYRVIQTIDNYQDKSLSQQTHCINLKLRN